MRCTGASKLKKHRSWIVAAISEAKPPVFYGKQKPKSQNRFLQITQTRGFLAHTGASWLTTRRPVLRTDCSMVSTSQGLIVCKSMSSQLIPISSAKLQACGIRSVSLHKTQSPIWFRKLFVPPPTLAFALPNQQPSRRYHARRFLLRQVAPCTLRLEPDHIKSAHGSLRVLKLQPNTFKSSHLRQLLCKGLLALRK